MVMKKRLLDIHRESDDQLDVIHRKINEVQQHVASLTEWKSAKEDSEAQSVKTHDEYDERLEKVKQDLGILQADRAFVVSFLKWVGVAIGGGIVTILIGLIQSKLNIR